MGPKMTTGNSVPMAVYVGAYADESLALADFTAIRDARAAGRVGKYQSAVFAKDADGKVRVLNTDSTTRALGAKWGAAVGAVASLLFPASLLVGLGAGTASGAVAGSIGKGWFSSDIKDLGDVLTAGESGVILVAQATPDVAADAILVNAAKTERKAIDSNGGDLMAALDSDA